MTALTTLLEAGVILQSGVSRAPEVDPGVGLGGGAFSAFLTTLLVGAIMIALAPGYTERMVDHVRNDIGESFIYGLLVLVVLILLTVILVLTIVGILVAIPLAILAGLVWAVGAVIGFLAIGERLVGSEDGWLKPLVVGALINGGLALTGIGGLVSFAVGAVGFGAVIRDWQGKP
jgi:hypothetical protein